MEFVKTEDVKLDNFVKPEESLCRLCLDVVNGKDFKEFGDIFKGFLHTLLPKLTMQEQVASVICNTCSTRLTAAFDFKATCMDTEDSILCHVNTESTSHINLKEIYLKERGKEALQEDEQICRLCMGAATSVTPLEEVDFKKIHIYLPEIKFGSTADPVICKTCLDCLEIHASFLKICLAAEDNAAVPASGNVRTPTHIKCEDASIKSEEDDEGAVSDNSESTSIEDPEPAESTTETDREPAQAQKATYKCDLCDVVVKSKYTLRRHKLLHKDLPDSKLHRCDLCDFKSRYKSSLRSHSLIHDALPEQSKFSCNKCDYRSETEERLERHRAAHHATDKAVHKCNKCPYETDQKRNITLHRRKHKDPAEVPFYKCEDCDYQTVYKSSMVDHIIKHKDPSQVQTYKCDKCNFETKRKSNLSHHRRQHKDPSQLRLHECDKCDFKTKYKGSLGLHKLSHVNAYKCDVCEYRTKREDYFKRHQSKHTEKCAVQVHRCDVCDFKTDQAVNLRRHRKRQKHFSDARMYQCDSCDFKTDYEHIFKRHVAAHQVSS